MKHTFYVVKNEAGEYLTLQYTGEYEYEYIFLYGPPELFTLETATHYVTIYGGTVKRVTIIEEDD